LRDEKWPGCRPTLCVIAFGVLAWTAAQRRKEIGIRMALGAVRGGIPRDVPVEGLALPARGTSRFDPMAVLRRD
jgi:hypothetical protein